MIAEELKIVIEAEVAKAVSELKKLKGSQDQAEKSTTGLTLSQIKSAAAAAGLTVALRATYQAMKTWAKAASDAEEITSKYNTVFRDMESTASSAAKNLADNYGLADSTAKELLSSTGDLLTGFGFTQHSALSLATQVNELAVDLASFSNFSGGTKGASEALTKALLGEAESVKSLGIVINQNSDRYKELIEYYTETEGLTEQQAKAYTALTIATEQSGNAIGDYARTSDSSANIIREFGERQKELNEELGKMALEVGTPVIKFLSDYAENLTKIIQQEAAWKAILASGIEGQSLETLNAGLGAAEKSLADLTKAYNTVRQGERGATKEQVALAQQRVANIKIQIQEETYLAKARENYSLAEIERKKKEADATLAAEATKAEAAKLEEERIIKRRDLEILSAQQVEEAQIAAMTRVADMENAWIAQQEENRKKTLADQQELANNLIDSYGFLAESVGMALVDSSKGWDYFKEQGKNAVIGVLKGFAKQWAAQAVAYYATGDFVRGSGMAGASAGAIVASGAVKAYAQGGSFTTAGEEFIKVGDNASGRERVTVQPLGTSDTTGVTQVLVYLSERVVLDAVARASADGRLIINARGVK